METTFTTHRISKRFFLKGISRQTGKETSFPISYVSNHVEVTWANGVKVVFMASNRSQMIKDSRESRKKISPDEAHSELVRMLGDDGEKAWNELMSL